MTTIHSIKAKNEMLKDATIEWLKEDLRDALDLIEIYKVALAEEAIRVQSTKTETRLVAAQVMDMLANGEYFIAQSHLQALYNSMR